MEEIYSVKSLLSCHFKETICCFALSFSKAAALILSIILISDKSHTVFALIFFSIFLAVDFLTQVYSSKISDEILHKLRKEVVKTSFSCNSFSNISTKKLLDSFETEATPKYAKLILKNSVFFVVILASSIISIFASGYQLGIIIMIISFLATFTTDFIASRISNRITKSLSSKRSLQDEIALALESGKNPYGYNSDDFIDNENEIKSAKSTARTALNFADKFIGFLLFSSFLLGFYLFSMTDNSIDNISFLLNFGLFSLSLYAVARIISQKRTVKNANYKYNKTFKMSSNCSIAQTEKNEATIFLKNTKLEFIGVFYSERYNGKALEGLSLTVNIGDKIAVLNGDCLYNFLLNISNFTSGEVLLNSVSVTEYPIDVLHNKIAFLFSESNFLDGSIYDNIRLGNIAINYDDVVKSLILTEAFEYISKLPDGIYSDISTVPKEYHGRIALARAIAKNPFVIIVEDCDFALDGILTLLENIAVLRFTNELSVLDIYEKSAVLQDSILTAFGKTSDILENSFALSALKSKSENGGTLWQKYLEKV